MIFLNEKKIKAQFTKVNDTVIVHFSINHFQVKLSVNGHQLYI